MKELPKEMKESVDTLMAIDTPMVAKIVQCSFIAGMQFAMRICRNRAEDMLNIGNDQRSNEAETCASMIRIIQVEIGAGRAGRPDFTKEELEEMDRIA